jgi:DNA-binding transcriptional ArsR family regulator
LAGHDGDVTGASRLAAVAGLLADRTRASICLALLDGRAWTVTELARHAGVAPSTASEHVTRLVNGAVLDAVRRGRQRYVRLADPALAHVIEDLLALSQPSSAPQSVCTPREARTPAAMKRARTCYDHLAGRLGVQITDGLIRSGVIEQYPGFGLASEGPAWLDRNLGIDAAALFHSRRPVVRSCLDWTERRPHLGGGLGAAVCGQFFDRNWLRRLGNSRAVDLTPAGDQALRQLWNIDRPTVA